MPFEPLNLNRIEVEAVLPFKETNTCGNGAPWPGWLRCRMRPRGRVYVRARAAMKTCQSPHKTRCRAAALPFFLSATHQISYNEAQGRIFRRLAGLWYVITLLPGAWSDADSTAVRRNGTLPPHSRSPCLQLPCIQWRLLCHGHVLDLKAGRTRCGSMVCDFHMPSEQDEEHRTVSQKGTNAACRSIAFTCGQG